MNRYNSMAVWAALVAGAAVPSYASGTDTLRTDVPRFPEHIQRAAEIKSTHVIMMGAKDASQVRSDSVSALIERFYVDQFRHFQDPRAPYFMFMSKNARLALGVGGVVRMRGWFDWNGSINANGFAPYLIDVPANPLSRRRLAATPAGTAVYFTIMGRTGCNHNFMGYVEGNFDGYNHVGFKLKKAYVTIDDWTVGYTTSTFADPAALPPTIDGAGPNGHISKTNVLVRYLHNFKGGWSVAGSLEFPSSQPEVTDGLTAKCNDYVPDVATFGQYEWDGGLSHVRLSAMARMISYRSLVQKRNFNALGWGVQVSSMFKIVRPLTFYALANVGQGHASYTGDLSIGAYDLIADPRNPGRLYAPTSMGLTAGAKYNFRPNLFACVALGEMHAFPKHKVDGSSYRYGLYGAVNVFWDITPRIEVGAEYLVGKRMNFDGSHASANRVDALFMFSF